MKIIKSLLLMSLISCGKEDLYVMQTTPDPGTEEDATLDQSDQDDIDEVVDEHNDYKDGNGQSKISEGLNCTVHNTANSDLDVSFGAVAHYFSLHTSFNQPAVSNSSEFNILPEELRSSYINVNFSIRCQGYFIATKGKRYKFTLDSDDGSRLYINGALIIDNEGNHAMTKKTGSIVLDQGVYSFRLDYSQSGGGDKGLILKVNGDGGEDKELKGAYFYR